MVERSAVNRLVVGSSPSWGDLKQTIYILTMLYMTNLIELQSILYYSEQTIYGLISSDFNFYSCNLLTFTLLLTSGTLTSLNPCFISIIPLSISYINSQKNRHLVLTFFIIGLSISLISLTMSIYYIHYESNWIIKSLPVVSSAIMILYGLSLLEIFNITSLVPNNSKNIGISARYPHYQALLAGITIGLTSTPCSTPIMATTLFWISSTSNFTVGLIYICFYIAGLIIPTTLILIFAIKSRIFAFMNLIWSKVVTLSGCFILCTGILSLLNKTFI